MTATAYQPLDMALAVVLATRRLTAIRDQDPWAETRRANQMPPPGDWRTWLVMAGRGFGKTRIEMEWAREEIMAGRMGRVALVGATSSDVREVMVEGPSGILAVCERYGFRPRYEPSRRRLTFPNGAIAKTYSAEEPDRLRGPEHDGAVSDEIGAWEYLEAWTNLQFGLRIGVNPRQIAGTTPKRTKLVREVLAQRIDIPQPDGTMRHNPEGTVVVTSGSTYDNAANLAKPFLDQIVRQYEGTRLGRQELLGELLEDVPGALWTLTLIDAGRVREVPPLRRIVVGVDPAASEGEEAAETGIVVVGVSAERDDAGNAHGYVLEDATVSGSPLVWARAVASAVRRWQADRVVAEINNGGLMVETTLRTVEPDMPITLVHASRGKLTRAEPVAALYEQGRAHHVGAFSALEDQMTTYDGTGTSPDRMDALVWAYTELMIDAERHVYLA